MDGNASLYLMLRVSSWKERKALMGRISGALWIRHIAEVIRRAFEEVHEVTWPEEDRAFGYWSPGGRKRAFGSERPLDDSLRAKSYIAYRFGLFTGSPVRWYVEGKTEYFAILEMLGEPEHYGIGLVDLRGAIEDGNRNVVMKLQDNLLEDKSLRRFSIVSFDYDVANNVRAIRRQVEADNIIGMIAAHKPDFEFCNFALEELVEIAAQIDERQGFSGEVVRNTDWSGTSSGRAFEETYLRVSDRKPKSLKGEVWGKALGKHASAHRRRKDMREERPIVFQVTGALHAWSSNYDFSRDAFKFDPITFERVSR